MSISISISTRSNIIGILPYFSEIDENDVKVHCRLLLSSEPWIGWLLRSQRRLFIRVQSASPSADDLASVENSQSMSVAFVHGTCMYTVVKKPDSNATGQKRSIIAKEPRIKREYKSKHH